MSAHQELRDAIGEVVVQDIVKNYVEVTVDALRLADLLGEFDAIAPPVAAGSVDTPVFDLLLSYVLGDGSNYMKAQRRNRLANHIDAWGAQQREAGFEEGKRLAHEQAVLITHALMAERDGYRRRAEKAEARLAELEREKVAPSCDCHQCKPLSFENNRMILCATCGNKRCPHANDHRKACTGSNEPGQAGSAYA